MRTSRWYQNASRVGRAAEGPPLGEPHLGRGGRGGLELRPTTGLFPLLTAEPDTGAIAQSGSTVRQHLVKWLTDSVREYGVDGSRCDTAEHVELAAWTQVRGDPTT